MPAATQVVKKYVLLAEDDADDRELLKMAFEEMAPALDARFVENGEEVLCYLHRHGRFKDEEKYPYPSLVILDLNMPKKDGKEVLREIKTDKIHKSLPVVILSTCEDPQEITKCYKLGANSYVAKPFRLKDMLRSVELLNDYWFKIVQLPS